MTTDEHWWLALAVLSVATVGLAVLLGLLIAAVKSVDRRASALSVVGKHVAANTVAIWTLEKTNEQLAAVRDSARSLEQTLTSMNAKLEALGSESAGAGSGISRRVEEWLGSSRADTEEGR